MTAQNTITTPEAQIRQLIADQQRAICTKDVDQIMARYAAEAIVFDVKPPFQTKGKAAIRQVWVECLPHFPDAFAIETQDLKIIVNDSLVNDSLVNDSLVNDSSNNGLAAAHWLFRFTGEEDHPAMQMWMRVTAVCQKNQGNWQILHEHISVPFAPETSQAVLTLNP